MEVEVAIREVDMEVEVAIGGVITPTIANFRYLGSIIQEKWVIDEEPSNKGGIVRVEECLRVTVRLEDPTGPVLFVGQSTFTNFKPLQPTSTYFNPLEKKNTNFNPPQPTSTNLNPLHPFIHPNLPTKKTCP